MGRVATCHSSGALVFDVEGREYIDFIGGIATMNVGHIIVRGIERWRIFRADADYDDFIIRRGAMLNCPLLYQNVSSSAAPALGSTRVCRNATYRGRLRQG